MERARVAVGGSRTGRPGSAGATNAEIFGAPLTRVALPARACRIVITQQFVVVSATATRSAGLRQQRKRPRSGYARSGRAVLVAVVVVVETADLGIDTSVGSADANADVSINRTDDSVNECRLHPLEHSCPSHASDFQGRDIARRLPRAMWDSDARYWAGVALASTPSPNASRNPPLACVRSRKWRHDPRPLRLMPATVPTPQRRAVLDGRLPPPTPSDLVGRGGRRRAAETAASQPRCLG